MERIVYEAFILCDLDAVGRFGIEKGRVYQARRPVRERMESEDEIHSGERAGRPWKQDVFLGAQDEVGHLRTQEGCGIAAHGMGDQGFEFGCRKACNGEHALVGLRLHGEYLFGFSTDRSMRCRHLGNPDKEIIMM